MAAMEKVCWVVYSNTQLIFFGVCYLGHICLQTVIQLQQIIFFIFVGMTSCGEL